MSEHETIPSPVKKPQGKGAAGGVLGGLRPQQNTVPPLPSREDSEVQAARELQRQTALKRSGRRKSILTSPRGVEDKLGTVNRPQARESQLLG